MIMVEACSAIEALAIRKNYPMLPVIMFPKTLKDDVNVKKYEMLKTQLISLLTVR